MPPGGTVACVTHSVILESLCAAAFDKAADVLVYDVLSSRVRRHLEDYAHLPVWDAPAEPSGGAGFEMPTFSAYPQACVTAVGEYLLMLPQQFEPLLGAGPSSPVGAPASSGGDVDDTRLASEWVARVAGGGPRRARCPHRASDPGVALPSLSVNP